jgi:hypothetical protein
LMGTFNTLFLIDKLMKYIDKLMERLVQSSSFVS